MFTNKSIAHFEFTLRQTNKGYTTIVSYKNNQLADC